MKEPVTVYAVFNRNNSKKIEKPIQLYIYRTGEKKQYLNTGLSTSKWNPKRNQPVNYQDAAAVQKIINKVEEFYAIMDKRNEPITKAAIVDYLAGKEIKSSNDFYQFYETYGLNNPRIKPGTKKGKLTFYKKMKLFRPKLFFSEIDYAFIKEFDGYLWGKELKQNYINKMHSQLRAIINEAIKEDIIELNPYQKFPLKTERIERQYLTKAELDILENMRPTIEKYYLEDLERFLFCCYTGLRLSDVKNITKKQFRYEKEHLIMDIFRMQKVDAPVKQDLTLLFNGRPKQIIEPRIEAKDDDTPLFNRIADQTYNRNLKVICALSGITGKNFVSHLGRHTFGTTIAKRTGNLMTVQSLMGISSPATAMVYINIAHSGENEKLDNAFKGF